MLAATIISLILGFVLGQRFKVLVIAPIIALMLLTAASASFSRPEGNWTFAGIAGLSIVALQIGYLLGITIRQFAAALLASRSGRGEIGASPERPRSH
jgi:hypothetical protein